MERKESMHFNKETPQIMWIDLNSAFATAEQQAHPSLRGKPLGVTNRISRECCVIAASYEAKDLGIKTGCRRSEAVQLYPKFILLETDPPKYHNVYKNLMRIMKDYSSNIQMKSIDEGIIDFHGTKQMRAGRSIQDIGLEIKQRVLEDIGNYTTINVGIGPNRFLAKTAAGLNKPDGLNVIDHTNIIDVYKKMDLQDLTGIADGFGSRLRASGVHTPMQFLETSEQTLQKVIFKSVNGSYWHKRLRGFEVDDRETNLGMVGRQWVIGNPNADEKYLRSCLHYLSETTGLKLRSKSVNARGVCVWLRYQDGHYFKERQMYKTAVHTDQDIWLRTSRLFEKRPPGALTTMGMFLYQLSNSNYSQLSLFDNQEKAESLSEAIDEINELYGTFTIHSTDTLEGKKHVKQKIPFGGTEYFDLLLKTA